MTPQTPTAEYDLLITRAERNPFYKAPPPMGALNHYDYGHPPRDERQPHEVEFDVKRVLSTTLTEGEFAAIKQALIAYWAVAKDSAASLPASQPVDRGVETR